LQAKLEEADRVKAATIAKLEAEVITLSKNLDLKTEQLQATVVSLQERNKEDASRLEEQLTALALDKVDSPPLLPQPLPLLQPPPHHRPTPTTLAQDHLSRHQLQQKCSFIRTKSPQSPLLVFYVCEARPIPIS